LAQQFVQMLRTHTGKQLDPWLEALASSPLTDLKSFAGSVYEDKELFLRVSQGQRATALLRAIFPVLS
jgi:hypothetical protein